MLAKELKLRFHSNSKIIVVVTMAAVSVNAATRKRKASEEEASTTICPYLDTVQRSVLDFDFEPACSVSLETGPHIYGCLVCGKYFRGRGPRTPAYTHSVEESHFVFVHLDQGTFHCLPDDYEIKDPSLQDIRAALHPSFTMHQIAFLDTNAELSRDIFGRRYLPGFVGLNNLNKTDCINAVVQALAHVPPLRDYFLQRSHNESLLPSASSSLTDPKKKSKSAEIIGSTMNHSSSRFRNAQHLTQCFAALVRKLWSDRRFKSHVDPHQLVQAVAVASKKRFQVGQQAEAGEFMAWFLHQLHDGTGGGKRAGSSIVHEVFQGRVLVTTREAVRTQAIGKRAEYKDDRGGSDDEEEEMNLPNLEGTKDDAPHIRETTVGGHFLQLTLDIPEKPLFRDEDGGLVIPQEPLSLVLKKFDGVSFFDAVSQSGVAQRKKYQLLKLPDYLILHLARFKTNHYNREKNPTIVAFPVKNLDLGDYTFPPAGKIAPPTEAEVRNMSVRAGGDFHSSPGTIDSHNLHAPMFVCTSQAKELKVMLQRYGQSALADGVLERKELVDAAVDFAVTRLPDLLADKYDLVGFYKCHVQHRGTNQWYEMQDLHVQEIMPQQIGLSESYVLIFERKSAQGVVSHK
jgi:U4/U6.U5 tri-snRNP-associated protein 2